LAEAWNEGEHSPNGPPLRRGDGDSDRLSWD